MFNAAINGQNTFSPIGAFLDLPSFGANYKRTDAARTNIFHRGTIFYYFKRQIGQNQNTS